MLVDHFIQYFLKDKIPERAKVLIQMHQVGGAFEGKPIELECFSNTTIYNYYNLVWRVQWITMGTYMEVGDTHHMINTSGEFHAMTEQWWTTASDDY